MKRFDTLFDRRTVLIGLGLAIIIEAVSLPIIGRSLWFFVGLAIGTVISALNLGIMAFFAEAVVNTGRRMLTILSFIIRVLLYVVALLFSLTKLGFAPGIGTALGLFTMFLAVIIVRAVRSRQEAAKDAQEKSPEYVYEYGSRVVDGQKRFMFVKSFSIEKYSGGRRYKTHRRFKKLKEIKR